MTIGTMLLPLASAAGSGAPGRQVPGAAAVERDGISRGQATGQPRRAITLAGREVSRLLPAHVRETRFFLSLASRALPVVTLLSLAMAAAVVLFPPGWNSRAGDRHADWPPLIGGIQSSGLEFGVGPASSLRP